MIKIAICDDEADVVGYIEQILSKYRTDKEIELECVGFSSGKSLLESKTKFDLLFLDIEMDDIDGIRTAKILRHHDRKTKIVFVTSHSECALKGYAVHPFSFAVKPVSSDEIMGIMDEYMQYYDKIPASVPVEFKGVGGSVILDLNDIYVLEYTGNRRVTVFTHDNRYEVRGGIGELLKLIKSDAFTSPHKSFIVNMEYINRMNKGFLYMDNNIEVPIAQKKQKEFQNTFSRFVGNCLRQE